MKSLPLLLALLAAFAMVGRALAKPPSDAKVFPYPMKVDKLPNGLTVVRVPFNSPGLVAYYSAVRVGSRNEVEAGHTGFTHFFEHMMFRGTKRYPEGAREKLLGAHGFDDNAFTGDDITVYHSLGPTSALAQLVEVEADRFRNLEYAEPSFQTEAKAVLGEYHKGAANPEQKLDEVLMATAFTRHTYQHTTIGFYEDIKKMPQYYEYSREFLKRWYTPDNLMLYVVGDFDDAALMALVRQHYGDWKATSAQVTIPTEPPQQQPRTAHIDWATPTLPRLIYAWHTPASNLSTTDGPIQSILGAYLAGTTSPLYKDLILDQQIAEQVGSTWYDHRDPHLFTLTTTLKSPEAMAKAKAAFEQAVKDLVAGKVDEKRVADIKSNLRYSLLMGLETPDQVAQQLAVYGAIFGDPDALDRYCQQLGRVQPKELVAFAKKYLVDGNRTTLTLTSKASAGGAP